MEDKQAARDIVPGAFTLAMEAGLHEIVIVAQTSLCPDQLRWTLSEDAPSQYRIERHAPA
jgi:hypothetical protein